MSEPTGFNPHILLGLVGPAGCGKTEMGIYLESVHQYTPGAFANLLRNVVVAAFPELDYLDFIEPSKSTIIPNWNLTPREILQLVGTECFRTVFGADFWIKSLELDLISELCPPTHVVITDVRFQNEVDWILNHGGYIVCIDRPGYITDGGIPNHPSAQYHSLIIPAEKELRICNDSTLSNFHSAIDSIAHHCTSLYANKEH